jgi:hypothetical protein
MFDRRSQCQELPDALEHACPFIWISNAFQHKNSFNNAGFSEHIRANAPDGAFQNHEDPMTNTHRTMAQENKAVSSSNRRVLESRGPSSIPTSLRLQIALYFTGIFTAFCAAVMATG